MKRSPFPGPKPYQASDRAAFRGRQASARKLASSILAHRCVTLFGPSGAGKSSLMQASVIPELIEDYDFRVVSIDSWPTDEEASSWLIEQVFSQLKLGDRPARAGDGDEPLPLLDDAIERAERRSDRPILIYLDQIEQVMLPGRALDEIDAFTRCADRLAAHEFRGLQLVLSMREDYLGRFRDHARGHRLLLEHGFRLGPFTVREITKAVLEAARAGEPPQLWPKEQTRDLMLQMRTPGQRERDDAEVQAAFVQIVCRALWEARREESEGGSLPASMSSQGLIEAAPILQSYLEDTLASLGEHRAAAVRLLDQGLVAEDGSRRLLTEAEARASSELDAAALSEVLRVLEQASILRAEEHRGSRYFELGHDWLATKVFEQRRERERVAAERAAKAQLARARADASAARRTTGVVALFAIFALCGGVFAWFSKRETDAAIANERAAREDADRSRSSAERARASAEEGTRRAEAARRLAESAREEERRAKEDAEDSRRAATVAKEAAERSQRSAEARRREAVASGREARESFARASLEARRARDAMRLAHALGAEKDDPTAMLGLLREVEEPGETPGWVPAVVDILLRPVSQAVLTGHRAGVLSARFSPDGRRVITASQDRTARVWPWREAGGEVTVLGDHVAAVRAARWSPDGAGIVTASDDWTARVYAVGSLERSRPLTGHRREVVDAQFDARGQAIVTSSSDGTVRVWSVDGVARATLEQAGESFTSAALDPRGSRIAAGARGGSVRLWSPSGADAARTFPGDGARTVRDVAWSPDGSRVAAAYQDGVVRIVRVDGRGPPRVLTGHEGEVVSARYDRRGARLVTASLDGTARVWDVAGATPPVVLGRPGDAKLFSAEWSPDGARVVTSGDDGVARVWSADGDGEAVTLIGHGEGVVYAEWSPDGRHVVTASRDGTARIWRVAGSRGARALRGHSGRVLEVMYSDDDRWILSRGADRSVRVFARDGAARRVLRHDALVVAMSYQSGHLLTLDARGVVRRFEVATGASRRVTTLPHASAITAAALCDLGDHAVTVTIDGARLWTLATGEAARLSGHSGVVKAVAFSRDDQRILTGGTDQRALVWRREGGGARVIKILPDHGGAVLDVAWSRDGALATTGSYDGVARLWRPGGDLPALRFEGHEAPVLSARFSASGDRVVTTSRDRSVRVWRVGGLPVVLRGHAASVTTAAFRGDGLRIVSGAADGSLQEWDADFSTETLRARIEEVDPVCLSAQQRARFLSEPRDEARARATACEAAQRERRAAVDERPPG